MASPNENSLCRLCCMDVNVDVWALSVPLRPQIEACLPVKLSEDDNLSKFVCQTCSDKVKSFYEFRLTVINTQKRLLDIQKSLKHNHKRNKIKKSKRKRDKEIMTKSSTKLNNFINKNDNNLEEIVLIKEENEDDMALCDFKVFQQGIVKSEDEGSPVRNLVVGKFDYENDINVDFNVANISDDASDCDDETFVIKKRTKKSTRRKNKGNKIKVKIKGLKCEDSSKFVVKLESSGNVRQDVEIGDDAEESDSEYNCCICFFKCPGRVRMLEHYRRHNKASSRYYNHPTKATNENGIPIEIFECNLCKSVFKNRKEFLAHYSMHRSNNGFRCSLCDKAYSTSADILEHGLTHDYDEASRKPDADQPKTLKLDPSEMRFLCELCDAKFTFFKSAKDHRVFDHPENKDPFLIRCIMCKEKFPTYWMIRKHLRSHREKLKSLCTICGKYLANNHKLNMHLRIHIGFKPFVCSVCSKGFVNSSRLREHERVHSGDRPYKCECGKKFTQRSSLVIHMRSHSGDRPYTCYLCQRGFISRGLLTMHQKTTCI